jgi:hypothetical protein
MLRDRKDLEVILYQAIESSKEDMRKNGDSLVKKLNEHNINAGKVMGIYNKSIPLITLPNAELYLFTKALFETTEYESINIRKWFTEEEVSTYNQYKALKVQKNNVMIIPNVYKTSDNRWFCVSASYTLMNEIFGQGFITYNIRTQRESKIVTFGNKFISIPDIRERPVLEMTDLMLRNKFTPNTITLNIRKIGTEKYDYNEKTNTLMIEVDGQTSFCDIIDGMHRCQAMLRTIEQNSNHEGYTYISILNYTESEAQEYIDQEDHRTPINKVHIMSFRNADEYVTLAKDINKYGTESNNELSNKIALNETELKTQDKYVTVDTFSRALKHNFKFENAIEIDDTKDFLIKYFNRLINILKRNNKRDSIAFKNNIFIGYIALASVLIKDENWKNTLEITFNHLNFKDDSYWSNMGILSNKVNASLIRNISEYFKKEDIVNV